MTNIIAQTHWHLFSHSNSATHRWHSLLWLALQRTCCHGNREFYHLLDVLEMMIFHTRHCIFVQYVSVVNLMQALWDISSHSPVPLATDKLYCHLMELEMLLTESQPYRYLKCVGEAGIRKEVVRTKQKKTKKKTDWFREAATFLASA